MKTKIFHHYLIRLVIVFGLAAAGFPTVRSTSAQASNAYVYVVREIELAELGIQSLEGLAYSPKADVLLAIQSQAENGAHPVAMVDRIEELRGVAELQGQPFAAVNTAFNDTANSLFILDTATQELSAIGAELDGQLATSTGPSVKYNLRIPGMQQARGIDFDPATGRLFILDPAGGHLWVITPDGAGNYDGDAALRDNRVQRVNLRHIANGRLNGLAYNPNSGTLFTLNQQGDTLYEITGNGELISTRDLSSFAELKSPAGMVFAPSGDTTDNPETKSLYIAEPSADTIVEVSITAVETMALPAASPISLVRTINTGAWNPPSPDPGGIDYNHLTNGLTVSDGEVEEMSIYQGKNVFNSTLSGTLQSTCVTTSFTKEPSALAIDPSNGNVFFGDDSKRILHQVSLGADGQYCTSDDQVRSANMATYGATDPEGIGLGEGKLFIADGTSAEVWIVSPGSNGYFDGAPPSGDDVVINHFDTAGIGLRDPEGIDYHPGRGTLIVVSRRDKQLVETSLSGDVVRVFDIAFLNAVSPAGIGIGPGSNNPTELNIYLAARGVDNNNDPNENDGKIYELAPGDVSGPTATPTPTSNTPTVTPTSTTPTVTPTQTTPTATPTPGSVTLYLSLASTGSGNLSFARDEDIIRFNGTTFSQFFDGSDVGVGGVDVDAFSIIDSNNILLSFDNAITLPNIGTVNDFDIVQFTASSFGDNTAGTFSLYFDGEDVGLSTSSEDIDALEVLSNGTVLISTSGGVSVPGVSGVDEDMLAFTPTSLGSNTSGTFSLYFDGSDVGLATDSGEDTDGLSITKNNEMYLSTRGAFAVTGVSGTASDIFSCMPASLGANTACTFNPNLFFTGSAWGITSNNVDGIELHEP